jgi:O-antigen/teichoic acid export membrane protein
VTVIAGAATGLLVLAAPALLDVLAPAAFGGTELVIALVASATLSRAAYFVAVTVLLDAKNTKPLARSSLAAGVLNIGLNVTLLPTFGLNAAAAATTAAVAVQSLMVIRASERHVDGSMRLGALCLVWAVGTAVMIGFAELPDTGSGVAGRIVLAVAMLLVGYLAVGRLRQLAKLAAPSAPAPSETLVPA